MNQEKFINTYIELLNSTISEAIQKNIVAQAQKKIFENDIAELEEKIADIEKTRDQLFQQKESQIRELVNDLNDARRQIGQISTQLEYNTTATQHFETYKNELVNCRKKNEDLLDLIAQKDKLLAKKDDQLRAFKVGPEPVVLNKLGKKNNAPTVEVKETKVEQPTKTVKVKSVRDAGSF